jgi:hypothetical protein
MPFLGEKLAIVGEETPQTINLDPNDRNSFTP